MKHWHYGKLVILWAWGGVICLMLLYLKRNEKEWLYEYVAMGLSLEFVLIIVPLALSVLTWHWLGGKERRHRAPSQTDASSDAK